MKSLRRKIFPRNLAEGRFYFNAPFGKATIRGRPGWHPQRSTRTHIHICSFNNKPICMHVYCVCTCVLPPTLYHVARFRWQHLLDELVGRKMRQHFEGGRISRYGEISRKYSSPLTVTNPIHMPSPFVHVNIG